MSLTVLEIEALRVPKRHSIGDSLYLEITNKGNRRWLFRYAKDGKKTWLGLGTYHKKSNTLKMAREKVSECRLMLNRGLDPAEENKKRRKETIAEHESLRSQVSFSRCADEWYERNESQWLNAKHRDQIKNTLRDYALPYIGKKNVADVSLEDIRKCLDPIWNTKTETANRVRQRIESVLSYAITNGYREGYNCAGWKDNLSNIYPPAEKVKRKRRLDSNDDGHFSALPYSDIPEFFLSLQDQSGIAALALQLTILTASRTHPIRMAKWSEFQLADNEWNIPAVNMKGKKPFRVALSTQAVALLRRLETVDDFVFPGGKLGMPLSDGGMLSLLKRMNRTDITVHGFRSSFRDYIGEETGHPYRIAEVALAHTVGDATEQAYARGDGFKKRLQMMQDWGNYCTSKT